MATSLLQHRPSGGVRAWGMTTPSVLKGPCSEESCETTAVARGLCPKHYHLARKYGSLPPKQPKQPTRFPSYCTQDDCSGRVKGHGLCEKHYQRWVLRGREPEALTDGSLLERRWSGNGNRGSDHHNWVGNDLVTYRLAHKRVESVKGQARDHSCVDCSAPAAQWSYVGGDADERHEDGLAFSVDPSFYQPRCVPCHTAFDESR